MIKRWVYVALAFGLGMSAMSCEKVKNYSDWNEIFDMVEAGSSCL